MIWLVLIAGMVALLAVSWLKPAWFANVWESSLKEIWVGGVGAVLALIEWLHVDPTWQQLVPPEYAPWAFVIIAFLGWLIRRVNVPKD